MSTGEIAKPARVSTGSAVEPYRKEVEAALAKGLSAQRIWQDLRADYGFGYNYASVKRFVRSYSKKTHREVADVMEHPPGKEAQVDFFEGPPTLDPETGKWRRPWIFRMTLSCSRHGYEEALWHQDQAHFIRAHEHAFESFGGVPEVVRQDNLKAAIVRACLYDPDVSELYAALAKHYGFVPLPSRPRHPQENGVEERSGGYVKDNALKGKHFNSLEELNDYLARWNRTIARLRIHGTTRKQVYTHFLEVEKPLLKPLPSERFALFEIGTRTVHPDGHIQVEGAYYSVPHILVGQEVKVHWDEHLVRVYARGRSVAVHSRHPAGAFATQKEHRPVPILATIMAMGSSLRVVDHQRDLATADKNVDHGVSQLGFGPQFIPLGRCFHVRIDEHLRQIIRQENAASQLNLLACGSVLDHRNWPYPPDDAEAGDQGIAPAGAGNEYDVSSTNHFSSPKASRRQPWRSCLSGTTK